MQSASGATPRLVVIMKAFWSGPHSAAKGFANVT